MNTTSPSLLEELRRPDANDAWRRFVELYSRLIYFWARKTGLAHDDACDLVQEVLVVAVRKLPEFQYEKGKSFRGWLRTIALNKWRNRARRKAEASLEEASVQESLAVSSLDSVFEEQEYRRQLAGRALAIIEADFQPKTWEAFRRAVTSDQGAAQIAADLGMTPGAVHAARSRVLTRLRQELAGLLD